MTNPNTEAEAIARQLHEVYERLAPEFGYKTRVDTREFDPNSPNGRLMIAVCGEVFGRLQIRVSDLVDRQSDTDKGETAPGKDKSRTGLMATIERQQQELGAAKQEAESLATSLWRKYYREESPEFELCDSVAGVISQIDNMAAGIGQELEALRNPWVSVEDKPLCVYHDNYWECTEHTDSMKYGFLAEIPTRNGVWIGHCIIHDEVGLQGVADEEPYDIGYEWESVARYLPIPPPEESK